MTLILTKDIERQGNPMDVIVGVSGETGLFDNFLRNKLHLNQQVALWFNHTGCLWDRDIEEWVVWFYVEPFTLQLNRDRDQHLLFPIVLVLDPDPVPALDTASVITP